MWKETDIGRTFIFTSKDPKTPVCIDESTGRKVTLLLRWWESITLKWVWENGEKDISFILWSGNIAYRVTHIISRGTFTCTSVNGNIIYSAPSKVEVLNKNWFQENIF